MEYLKPLIRILLLFRPDLAEKVSWLKNRYHELNAGASKESQNAFNDDALRILREAYESTANMQFFPYTHILEAAEQRRLLGYPMLYRFPQLFPNDLGPRKGTPAGDTPTLFTVTVWVWPLQYKAIYECCGVVRVADIYGITDIREIMKFPVPVGKR